MLNGRTLFGCICVLAFCAKAVHCQDSLPKYVPSYSKSIPWPDSGSGNEPPKAFEASKGAQIFVQTLCLKVPSGFCARAGLTPSQTGAGKSNIAQRASLDEVVFAPFGFINEAGRQSGYESPNGPWSLTPREIRMLEALLRHEKQKEILGRPQIVTLNDQTATIGLNHSQDYITGLEASESGGKITYQAKKQQVLLGHSLEVTPRMAKDGSIQLRVTTSETSLSGNVVEIPVTMSGELKQAKASTVLPVLYPGEKAAFNVQQVDTTVEVPAGCSAVIRGVVSKVESSSNATEVIWILTPRVIAK